MELEDAKVTVPVGELPETVAVQVVAEPVEPEGAGVVLGEHATVVVEADWVSGVTEGVPGAGLGVGAALARGAWEGEGAEETSGDIVLTMNSVARMNAHARPGRPASTFVMLPGHPSHGYRALTVAARRVKMLETRPWS